MGRLHSTVLETLKASASLQDRMARLDPESIVEAAEAAGRPEWWRKGVDLRQRWEVVGCRALRRLADRAFSSR